MAKKRAKKRTKRTKGIRMMSVMGAADKMVQINFSDHGTWGGNVTDLIYDLKEKLSDTEKIFFIAAYLAKERDEITKWLFSK